MQFNNVKEFFDVMRGSKTPHLVLRSFREMHSSFLAPKLCILTDSKPEFISSIGAEPYGPIASDRKKQIVYTVPYGTKVSSGNPDGRVVMHVTQKGSGILPSGLEAKLLRRRIVHNNTVYGPDAESEFHLLLFLKFIVGCELETAELRPIKEMLAYLATANSSNLDSLVGKNPEFFITSVPGRVVPKA